MALILPVFLLVAIGILDLGRAFYDYERIQNAAREGAMWLSQHPSATVAQVTARVQSEGIVCGGGQPVQVTTSRLIPPNNSEAEVAVSCRFDLITPFMGTIVGSQRLTLNGYARMPVMGP